MTHEQLGDLKQQLCNAADDPRANSILTTPEYKDPLLGLVLLHFTENRHKEARIYIENNRSVIPRNNRGEKFFKTGGILIDPTGTGIFDKIALVSKLSYEAKMRQFKREISFNGPYEELFQNVARSPG